MSNNHTTENTSLKNQVYTLKMAVIFLFVLILISFCLSGYAIGVINGYIEGKEQSEISTKDAKDAAPIFHQSPFISGTQPKHD